jgi:hypothetical protein
VDVELKISSLLKGDTIVVKKIQIDAPNISYESKDGVSNFDAIQANAKKSESEEKAKTAEKGGEKKAAKKVIIETFTLNGAKVSCTAAWTFGKPITLPLPSMTLRDIGKASGGTSPVEAVTQVINEIVGGLTKAITGVAGQAGDLLKGAAGGASDAAKGAADGVKNAAKSLKSLFK